MADKKDKDKKGKRSVEEMKSWDDFETTKEIYAPDRIIDQVIGQDKAVDIIKKAAKQRRHVLLIGEPGTGKSMLAGAIAELLPAKDLVDIIAFPNPDDENNPRIGIVSAGNGVKLIENERKKEASTRSEEKNGESTIFFILIFFGIPLGIYAYLAFTNHLQGTDTTLLWIMAAIGIFFLFFKNLNLRAMMMMGSNKSNIPKLIVDNSKKKIAPFFDGTGAHSGALLGDVKHDPLQTGGLGTPPHLRVVSGMIHKAHKGVLFIDEISSLGRSQQDLLTAIQEKKLAITGRSEMSSGAMVLTDPVPCDFVLVAAGNMHDMEQMHPALRSRIRGYGYEVYMEDTMKDNDENRRKIVQFIAQEVKKDKKIPHFTVDAVREVITEFKRKAGTKNRMTLIFREMGGLIRSAGDIASEKKHRYVTADDVTDGKKSARALERQFAEVYLERKKEYNVFATAGFKTGVVNGLAVIGDAGIILPIVAEVTPSQSEKGGTIIATGKLGEIAKESVINVSALIKSYSGKDLSNHDIHIQFLQTYEGVEGDSASISVAVAVISALENTPVKQNIAMTGSLTVRGKVLPVGGITSKIEAAIESGVKTVIIPKSNENDVFLEKRYGGKIEILLAETLADVLEHSLKSGGKIVKKVKQVID